MKVRFQADADLDARIVRGLKRRLPGIGFPTASETGLAGLPDPEVLRIAAELNRIRLLPDHRAELALKAVANEFEPVLSGIFCGLAFSQVCE